ncbi:MAG: hypothetical protein J4O03_13455 [Chloroflexi bacterium]|nr:hypothetical protein [Chloroflexota bacterium]MCI0781646.1 hypothetical protein [Chloroflexota bacterium]MCI0786074.1 hypothetical protein [Chloroflexota bacterium]MCI0794464.1 hypothetical protein [Chloroflexota bacterium]MCI0799149.1 hypothetical protein [Chloroflexota bacterium]
MSKKRMMAPQNRTVAPKDKKPVEPPAKPPPGFPPLVVKSSLRSDTGRGGYRDRASTGGGAHPLAPASGDSPEESLGDILVESDPDGGPMVIWFLGRPS